MFSLQFGVDSSLFYGIVCVLEKNWRCSRDLAGRLEEHNPLRVSCALLSMLSIFFIFYFFILVFSYVLIQ